MRLIRTFEAAAKATRTIDVLATVLNSVADVEPLVLTADAEGSAGNDLAFDLYKFDQIFGSLFEASATGFKAFRRLEVDPSAGIKLLNFVANDIGQAGNRIFVRLTYSSAITNNTAEGQALVVQGNQTFHVVRIRGTVTLKAIVDAFNAIENKTATASVLTASEATDTVDWGSPTAATGRGQINENAVLTVTAKEGGVSGNRIIVRFQGGGAGNNITIGRSESDDGSTVTITISVAGRRSLAQVAAAINADSQNPITAVASGSNATTAYRANTQGFLGIGPGGSGEIRLSGGLPGVPPETITEPLRLGENAIPGLTRVRVAGTNPTMTALVNLINGISDGKKMTASLGGGANGNAEIDVGLPRREFGGQAVIPFARLTGGENAPSNGETLVDADGRPIHIVCGGTLAYAIIGSWTPAAAGQNMTVKLQRLIRGIGADGADDWRDWDTDNHTQVLNGGAGKATEVVQKLLPALSANIIPGTYRFRANSNIDNTRGSIAVVIDEQVSTGINPDRARDGALFEVPAAAS